MEYFRTSFKSYLQPGKIFAQRKSGNFNYFTPEQFSQVLTLFSCLNKQ